MGRQYTRAQVKAPCVDDEVVPDRGATLFFGGDTMLGRGIDQILPHRSDPTLHESWVKDANGYVRLAEAVNGPIERPAAFDYVWGDALAELRRMRPVARIVNLETSITTCPAFEPGKGIHYRMHPGNVPCLAAAEIDCCVLANNHVLDWGTDGLLETLATLRASGIATAGAGADPAGAERPAELSAAAGPRVLVFGFGMGSSGIPLRWKPDGVRPGVNLLDGSSPSQIAAIAALVRDAKRPGDLAVASIHWGPNWGYAIPADRIEFAHRLIDECAVDIVHGHSSHHALGIEVYRSRPIIYGCGDLLNDYEGIRGHEDYRGDLSLLYFPRFDTATGELIDFRISVMQIRRFALKRPAETDVDWLTSRLQRESGRFDTQVTRDGDQLVLTW
jgi:poly-gamma-glutamate capsule biosynthesis protein CapA/YwtB (metallophosphatase superfamily)